MKLSDMIAVEEATYQEANFCTYQEAFTRQAGWARLQGGWEKIATQRLLSQASSKNTTPHKKFQNPTRSNTIPQHGFKPVNFFTKPEKHQKP
jgi:hypothetical protein